jgi:hypothetical protein
MGGRRELGGRCRGPAPLALSRPYGVLTDQSLTKADEEKIGPQMHADERRLRNKAN